MSDYLDTYNIIKILSETSMKLTNFFWRIPCDPKISKYQIHEMDDGGAAPLNEKGLLEGEYFLNGKKLKGSDINPFKEGVTFRVKEKDKETGKDITRLGKMADFVMPQRRLAAVDDFDELLEIEANIRGTDVTDRDLISDLISDISGLIELHKAYTQGDKNRDYQIIKLARSFIEYLELKLKPTGQSGKKGRNTVVSFHLRGFFSDVIDYVSIMDLMADNKYVTKGNYKPLSKFNISNQVIFLDVLGQREYLATKIIKADIPKVMKDTFGTSASVSRIYQIEQAGDEDFKFIHKKQVQL